VTGRIAVLVDMGTRTLERLPEPTGRGAGNDFCEVHTMANDTLGGVGAVSKLPRTDRMDEGSARSVSNIPCLSVILFNNVLRPLSRRKKIYMQLIRG
jgi:hypothetical protein